MFHRVAAVVAIASCSHIALSGPEWPEVGDAGSLPGTAQTVIGVGPLSKISGQLEGVPPLPDRGLMADFQDMYRIRINNPAAFFASTDLFLGGSSTFDSNLFLFTLDGRGLLANLGIGLSATITSLSNDGSNAELVAPGDYYLAITGGLNVPVAGPEQIFSFLLPNEISGPDGPGGAFPITDWTGPGQVGFYEIALQGAVFIPAPASLSLLVLGACTCKRRRY